MQAVTPSALTLTMIALTVRATANTPNFARDDDPRRNDPGHESAEPQQDRVQASPDDREAHPGTERPIAGRRGGLDGIFFLECQFERPGLDPCHVTSGNRGGRLSPE